MRRLLQSAHNAATRFVVGVCRGEHTTPLLRELNWIPILQRVRFKLATFALKSLNSATPAYLECLFIAGSSLPQLRTSNMEQSACHSLTFLSDSSDENWRHFCWMARFQRPVTMELPCLWLCCAEHLHENFLIHNTIVNWRDQIFSSCLHNIATNCHFCFSWFVFFCLLRGRSKDKYIKYNVYIVTS